MENKEEFNIDEYTRKVFDLEFDETGVDLRSCMRGDQLVCKDGRVIYYVQPLPDGFYEHEVAEKKDLKATGTRTHQGRVLKASNTDSDIVEIIRKT